MITPRSMKQTVLALSLVSLFGCGATSEGAVKAGIASPTANAGMAARPEVGSSPLTRFGGHILVVTARIGGGPEEKFILDTGAGINLISKSACARITCRIVGEHIGQRMSGQSLKVPMTEAPIAFASMPSQRVPAGVLDLEALGLGAEFAGFLSLSYFRNQPFTIDYAQNRVSVETPASLAARRSKGLASKIRLTVKGSEVAAFLPLGLPNGSKVEVEVDTGSDALILNEPHMSALGFQREGANIKRLEGKDETGHAFVRYFSKLAEPVRLFGAPSSSQASSKTVADLPVMFQTIIYDGLVGDALLRRFTVTFDLPNNEMIFADP
jgi:hypothetical protein